VVRDRFQSLSGFLMRCDRVILGLGRATSSGFQSLSGFLMRCDPAGARHTLQQQFVSIPIGFSDAL